MGWARFQHHFLWDPILPVGPWKVCWSWIYGTFKTTMTIMGLSWLSSWIYGTISGTITDVPWDKIIALSWNYATSRYEKWSGDFDKKQGEPPCETLISHWVYGRYVELLKSRDRSYKPTFNSKSQPSTGFPWLARDLFGEHPAKHQQCWWLNQRCRRF